MDLNKLLKYLLAVVLAMVIIVWLLRLFIGFTLYEHSVHETQQAIERFRSLD